MPPAPLQDEAAPAWEWGLRMPWAAAHPVGCGSRCGYRQAQAGNGERSGLGSFGGVWGLVCFFPGWIKGLSKGSCRIDAWRFSPVLQPGPGPGRLVPVGVTLLVGGGSRSLGITSSHQENPPAAPRARPPTEAAMGMANGGNWTIPSLSLMSMISLRARRNCKCRCFREGF